MCSLLKHSKLKKSGAESQGNTFLCVCTVFQDPCFLHQSFWKQDDRY